MPVAAPADKRFRRSHVRPGKKRRWIPSWRTLVIVAVVAIGALYVVSRVAGYVLRAEALTINNITVKGTHRMAPGEALALLDGLRGTSMITVDLEQWRQKLLLAPWVDDVTMRLMFPRTVSVVITERQPLGLGRIKNALYLIDRDGAVIDEFGPRYAELDLPLIDGLTGVDDDARAALAGRILADLQGRPDLAALVSQIDVSNDNDAVVLLENDTALVRTGNDRFVERIQAYLDYAPRFREDTPEIDSVDMRFERVFVKPRRTGR